MIKFQYDPNVQANNYKTVNNKLKTQFYQKLKFYILPFMPEKFRNRVVFLPEVCEPEKIYRKQKATINKLEQQWVNGEKDLVKKLIKFFPKLTSIDIVISPQLYGTIGSYYIKPTSIVLSPRYDRKLIDLQRLTITALTHYFFFEKKAKKDKPNKEWFDKQRKSEEIENIILPYKKDRSMIKVLDTEFAGQLAQKSSEYLEKMGLVSQRATSIPRQLTNNELKIYNLLFSNKNRVVSYDLIGDVLWTDNLDKYSEYAITKLVNRLKRKLPKNTLQSQRGVGYILHI